MPLDASWMDTLPAVNPPPAMTMAHPDIQPVPQGPTNVVPVIDVGGTKGASPGQPGSQFAPSVTGDQPAPANVMQPPMPTMVVHGARPSDGTSPTDASWMDALPDAAPTTAMKMAAQESAKPTPAPQMTGIERQIALPASNAVAGAVSALGFPGDVVRGIGALGAAQAKSELQGNPLPPLAAPPTETPSPSGSGMFAPLPKVGWPTSARGLFTPQQLAAVPGKVAVQPFSGHNPIDSESLLGLTEAAGLTDRPDLQPQNAIERTEAAAAQGVGMMLPTALTGGASSLPAAMRLARQGAALGVGSELGGDVGGAIGGASGAAIGGVIGGLAPSAIGTGAARLASAARPLLENSLPVSKGIQERLAAQSFAPANTPTNRAALADPQSLVPGSPATSYQVTGDPFLGAQERGISNRVQYKPAFDRVRQEQNNARVATIKGQAPLAADPTTIAPWFRGRLADLHAQEDEALARERAATQAAVGAAGEPTAPHVAGEAVRDAVTAQRAPALAESDARLQAAEGAARTATENLGGELVGGADQAHGARMRGAWPQGEEAGSGLLGAKAQERAAAQRLFDAVDPEKKLVVGGLSSVRDAASILRGDQVKSRLNALGKDRSEFLSEIGAASKGDLAGPEAKVLDFAATLKNADTFQNLRKLLRMASAAQREIAGNLTLGRDSLPYKRMTELRDEVEAAMSRGAGDAAGRDSAVGDKLATIAGEEGHGPEAGERSGQGNGGGSGGGAPGLPRAGGSQGEAGGGSRPAGGARPVAPSGAVPAESGSSRRSLTAAENALLGKIRNQTIESAATTTANRLADEGFTLTAITHSPLSDSVYLQFRRTDGKAFDHTRAGTVKYAQESGGSYPPGRRANEPFNVRVSDHTGPSGPTTVHASVRIDKDPTVGIDEAARRASILRRVQKPMVENAATTVPPQDRSRRPESLIDFLIARGGVQDQGGDLKAIGADTVHHQAGGRLVNARGVYPDYAREAAEEEGFLRPHSTINDLYDSIANEISGRPVYRQSEQAAGDAWANMQREADRNAQLQEQAAKLVEGAFHEADHAAQLVLDGVHPDEAVAQAARGGEEAVQRHAEANALGAPGVPLAAQQAEMATEHPQMQPNFTPEDRAKLKAAHAGWADYKNRFGRGAVGNVLQSSAGGYRIPDSMVPAAIFQSGPKGAEAADSLIKAMGSQDAALHVLGEYPAYSLRSAAEDLGTLSVPKYQDWLKKYGAVLDKFPELKAQFDTAAKARGVLDDLRQERAALDATNPLKPGWGDAEIMERFVQPGPKGYESAARLLDATGSAPTAMAATRDYLASSLRDAAEVKSGPNAGTLDSGAYQRWLTRYGSFLSHPAFASVKADFENAGKAQAQLDASAADHAAALRSYQTSVARHFLPDDVDPVSAIGKILGSDTANAQMADLARQTATDPAAREAIQAAVVRSMLRRLQSNNPVGADLEQTYLKSNETQNFIRQQAGPDGPLRHIMTPAQIKALNDTATDIRRANLSISGNRPAGSDTGLITSSRQADEHRPSLAGTLAVMETFGEVAREALGPWGRLAGMMLVPVMQAARRVGFETVNDLRAEALLHPEKMSALLAKLPTGAQAPSRVAAIRAQLAALPAGSRAAQDNQKGAK